MPAGLAKADCLVDHLSPLGIRHPEHFEEVSSLGTRCIDPMQHVAEEAAAACAIARIDHDLQVRQWPPLGGGAWSNFLDDGMARRRVSA